MSPPCLWCLERPVEIVKRDLCKRCADTVRRTLPKRSWGALPWPGPLDRETGLWPDEEPEAALAEGEGIIACKLCDEPLRDHWPNPCPLYVIERRSRSVKPRPVATACDHGQRKGKYCQSCYQQEYRKRTGKTGNEWRKSGA